MPAVRRPDYIAPLHLIHAPRQIDMPLMPFAVDG